MKVDGASRFACVARWVVPVVGAMLLLLVASGTTAIWAWRYTEPVWLMAALVCAAWGIGAAWIFDLRGVRTWCERWLGRHHRVLLGGVLLSLSAALVTTCTLEEHTPSRETAPGPSERIAVIGAGAAGVHAAWMLSQAGRDFQLYEASPRVGGHAYSAPFQTADGSAVELDIGFLFGSPQGYQGLKLMMALYGVDRVDGDVAFTAIVDGHRWSTGHGQAPSPEVERFQRLCESAWDDEQLDFVPFGLWLRRHGFGDAFRRRYLTPYLTLLFLTPKGFYEYSTRFMASMFAGHDKFLDFRWPMRVFSIAGGSARYYRAVTAGFESRLRLGEPVVSLRRGATGVVVTSVTGDGARHEEIYAGAILAVPADVARRIVVDNSGFEDAVLAQIRYDDADVVLHGDTRLLPSFDEGGAEHRGYSWLQEESWGERFELSAELGPIVRPGERVEPPAIGTLNPQRTPEDVRLRKGWRHFVQDIWHFATVFGLLPEIQGRGNVWYAGSWVSHIGHESAMRSGVRAACRVASLPPTIAPAEETRPCARVRVTDEEPAKGVVAQDVEMCGPRDVYGYLFERHCKR